jgi:hypothetical protein
MWESYPRSITAMTCFFLFVYFFEFYHVPIILLLLFAKSHVNKRISDSLEGRYQRARSADQESSPTRFDSDDEDTAYDNSSVSFLSI